jgi:hypothetical protein
MTGVATHADDSSLTLREKADKWIEENDRVMDLFSRFAEERRAMGRQFGAKALTERVRWECALSLFESPKINNNFTAYIARELVRRDPRLADLIECRVTKAADKLYREPSFDARVDPLTDAPIHEGVEP